MQYPEDAIEIIRKGGVGAMPTDTIFGLVASALDQDAVEAVYEMKGRDSSKPCVVLISDIAQLEDLGINIQPDVAERLKAIWLDPVSIILACPEPSMGYLHRNKFSLAIRLPDNLPLRNFIEKTGPIIATSVNKSGYPALNNLEQIKTEFPGLHFYIDGESSSQASRLARLRDDFTVEWMNRS